MKKKVLFIVILMIGCFMISGCDSSGSSVKTVLTCTKNFTLFHSKQQIENVLYLDKDNKLVKYEANEIYTSFDSELEYQNTCDGLSDEAEADSKRYDYLSASTKCSPNTEVKYSNLYDISKISSKSIIPSKEVKEYLDDNYLLDIEGYKNRMIGKSYICE